MALVASAGFAQRGPGGLDGPLNAAGATLTESANAAPRRVPASSLQEQNLVLGRYCFRCHNDQDLTGGLSFEAFDVARAADNAEVAERMIRKLRTGMMPPPPAQRPDAATY